VDWRLHATYDPAAGRFSALALTDGRGAESFGRAEFAPGDVAMGDRCYARPPALQRILDCGADFIVRVGSTAFDAKLGWTRLRLLAENGEPVDWAALFDRLAPGETAEPTVSVAHAGAGGQVLFAARLIVLRLSPEAAARAAKALHRRQSRCRAGKALQPLTVRATGYLMLLTSLPPAVPAAAVLAAYRLRWQVELAFKRLKSLLGFDRLPAKSEALARSWLLAHLILALLIDDAAQDLLDSPPSAT
jgi:Transposase DDE domain